MARRRREDEPGSIHHVYNRAIARRPMFESRDEFRTFIALIACAVRRGENEVFAYCLMHTHYHLVLRVRNGALSTTMQRIQTNYSRYFNRRHRRDGPLMRGRFASRRIRTRKYLEAAIRYVESNGVDARLASAPERYEFGSARSRREHRPPRWLLGETPMSHATISSAPDSLKSWSFIVEQRLTAHSEEEDEPVPLRLSPSVVEWMRRKRALSDSGGTPLAVARPEDVSTAFEVFGEEARQLSKLAASGTNRISKEVKATLLVRLCGLRQGEVAARLKVSQPTVSRMLKTTDRRCDENPSFERLLARFAANVAQQHWSERHIE